MVRLYEEEDQCPDGRNAFHFVSVFARVFHNDGDVLIIPGVRLVVRDEEALHKFIDHRIKAVGEFFFRHGLSCFFVCLRIYTGLAANYYTETEIKYISCFFVKFYNK